MQAFFCDCVRARTKLGIAIAAKQADDGHHDHNFHQGEARFAGGSVFHINFVFLSLAA